jgi:hypothetical protein
MDSVRGRAERSKEPEAPPAPIPQSRRHSGFVTQASVSFTRDREIAKAANALPPKTEREKWQDHYWAKYKREEQAKQDAAIEKERQRQEALKQEQQRANAKALREFELTQCESVLIDATVEESAATAELVKRKYKDSIMDPTAWSLAKDEVRNEARVRAVFMNTLSTKLENTTPEDLAHEWNCSPELVDKLLEETYPGWQRVRKV